MALIRCPECGTEVSNKADKCPKCAYPITGGRIRTQILALKLITAAIIGFILLIIFINMMGR